MPACDPLLIRSSNAFGPRSTNSYGARLERVVVSTARGRGDPHPDSDHDVSVFLRRTPDRITEL
jgi:hypothetical protein